MPSAPQSFKKNDMARMVRAAQAAGLRITGVTLEGAAGRVVLQVGAAPQPDGGEQQQNEWDEAYGPKTSEVRKVGAKPRR